MEIIKSRPVWPSRFFHYGRWRFHCCGILLAYCLFQAGLFRSFLFRLCQEKLGIGWPNCKQIQSQAKECQGETTETFCDINTPPSLPPPPPPPPPPPATSAADSHGHLLGRISRGTGMSYNHVGIKLYILLSCSMIACYYFWLNCNWEICRFISVFGFRFACAWLS